MSHEETDRPSLREVPTRARRSTLLIPGGPKRKIVSLPCSRGKEMQMSSQQKRSQGKSKSALALYEQDLQERLDMCGLTERQQEVVKLVIWGLSNREIAEKLSIEEYTVKVHLRDIFQRLNIHCRTALMTKIFQFSPICRSPVSALPNLVESTGSLPRSRSVTPTA